MSDNVAANPEIVLRPRGMFYAMRFPNFRLFFVGQLISVAGSWMQLVAQQWLVYSITHSSAWLGIVSGASAIPYVAFSLAGGRAADRYSRRSILIWTQAAAMLLAFILAALASNRWTPVQPWHIALLAALGGIVNAYTMPAQQAFVGEMIDEPDALANAIALNSLRFNFARFLGPILAGVVLVKAGAAACFALNGLSFIAVIISLAMMRLPLYVPREGTFPVREGFGFVWRSPALFRTVALVGAASLFAWSVSTLYPAFAEHFERGARGFSTIVSVNGFGAAMGGLSVAWIGDRIARRSLVYGGAAVFCAALFTFSSSPTFSAALASLWLGGFSMIVFAISANTKVQEDTPPELRGRVMAIYSLVFQGLMPLGGLEIGFLADAMGPVRAVRLNAIIYLATIVSLFAWSQAERKAGLLTTENTEGHRG